MVSPAEKCFLPSEAGFSGFLARRSRTNKCQHLCQMGEDGIFAPHNRKSRTTHRDSVIFTMGYRQCTGLAQKHDSLTGSSLSVLCAPISKVLQTKGG